MICCWLTSTYKTFVEHCLNRGIEVILEEKTERESGAGKRKESKRFGGGAGREDGKMGDG